MLNSKPGKERLGKIEKNGENRIGKAR